jgi:hypothetical protein
MDGERGSLEQHRQLATGQRLARWVLRKSEQRTETAAFETAVHQIESKAVAHQRPKLSAIALDEHNAVPIVGIRAKPIGLTQQAIKPLPEVHSVRGKNNAPYHHWQHELFPLVYALAKDTRMDHVPNRSSRPRSTRGRTLA